MHSLTEFCTHELLTFQKPLTLRTTIKTFWRKRRPLDTSEIHWSRQSPHAITSSQTLIILAETSNTFSIKIQTTITSKLIIIIISSNKRWLWTKLIGKVSIQLNNQNQIKFWEQNKKVSVYTSMQLKLLTHTKAAKKKEEMSKMRVFNKKTLLLKYRVMLGKTSDCSLVVKGNKSTVEIYMIKPWP